MSFRALDVVENPGVILPLAETQSGQPCSVVFVCLPGVLLNISLNRFTTVLTYTPLKVAKPHCNPHCCSLIGKPVVILKPAKEGKKRKYQRMTVERQGETKH